MAGPILKPNSGHRAQVQGIIIPFAEVVDRRALTTNAKTGSWWEKRISRSCASSSANQNRSLEERDTPVANSTGKLPLPAHAEDQGKNENTENIARRYK